MRSKAKEAGLMKLDKLIAKRQSVPTNEFPIPVKELCERFEKLYTGCVNDVMREACLLDQNLPHEIMPLRDEMVVCGEAFTVKSAPNCMIEGEMTFRARSPTKSCSVPRASSATKSTSSRGCGRATPSARSSTRAGISKI
jgi:hypothetical protein